MLKFLFSLCILFSFRYSSGQEGKAAEVINRYLDAAGGKNILKTIQTKKTVYSGEVYGRKIRFEIFQSSQGFYHQNFSLDGIERKIIFDGKHGRNETEEYFIDMNSEEDEFLKTRSSIFIETACDTLDIQTEYLGKGKRGEESCSIICFRINDKFYINSWYSDSTGLKVYEEMAVPTPGGVIIQKIEYYDYRKYKGVNIPHTVEVLTGNREIKLLLKNVIFNLTLD